MKTSEFLQKALDLISPPARWTKGSYESSKRFRNKYVVCYCAVGALQKIEAENSAHEIYIAAYNAVKNEIPKGFKSNGVEIRGIVPYNDLKSTRKGDVIRLFERAIRKTRAAERKAAKSEPVRAAIP